MRPSTAVSKRRCCEFIAENLSLLSQKNVKRGKHNKLRAILNYETKGILKEVTQNIYFRL